MSYTPLNVPNLKYSAMIGTGGIGGGIFFALNGDHLLGREESRSGRFLDRDDYCKLHIISHYVQVLLGPGFNVIPIGKIGNDDLGARLRNEMSATGMTMSHVSIEPNQKTSLCICYLYPDGSGGNLTPDDSACSLVTSDDIDSALPEFEKYRNNGIALAAPEVPLAPRKRLLETATDYGFLRAASFTSEEIKDCMDWLGMIDLLAINIDEARALAGTEAENADQATVDKAIEIARIHNPAIQLSITAGSSGSWVWDGNERDHQPVLPAEVASTAGAGDCHFSGLLAGLATGLSLKDAHRLAALAASYSVTAIHTINKALDSATLSQFAIDIGAILPTSIEHLLKV